MTDPDLDPARAAHAYADEVENHWLRDDALETAHGPMRGDRLRDYAAMVRATGDSRALVVACELLLVVVARLDALAEPEEESPLVEDRPCVITAGHPGHLHWDRFGTKYRCRGVRVP